ncbi:MAG: flagellin [Provencibacterium sp.]|nr:flagellin [Provencibacterium sp.]
MVVRSNIMALNANRQLGMNNSQVSKSLEKLSSGFKINRAGDDASGLAISEKMKAQIKALDTASANCQDGISLVQTAEGALTEVHDMLNRMVELAGKSANGTMETPQGGGPGKIGAGGTDRDALQEEMDALCKEIDRIAASTNFNGIKLLDGSLGGSTTSSNTVNTAAPSVTIDATDAAGLGAAPTFAFDAAATDEMKAAFNEALGEGADITFTAALAGASLADNDTLTIAGLPTGYTYTVMGADGTSEITDSNGTLALTQDSADQTKANLSSDISIIVKDKDGKTVGTLDVALSGATLASGTSTVSLAASTAAADGVATAAAGDVAASYNYDLSGMTALQDGESVTIAGVTIAAKATGVAATDLDVGANTTLDDQLTAIVDILNADATINNDWTATVQDGVLTLTAKDPDNLPANAPADASWNGTDVTADAVEDEAPDNNTTGGNTGSLTLQIGEDGQRWNQMKVAIDKMDVTSLFAKSNLTMSKNNTDDAPTIDISSQKAAQTALDAIRTAVNTVSTQRAKLGAIQNRLEHTINNLDVASENMNSANSRVRDTDMAKQMMSYTQMNVLTQAAQAMLAQANQQPQSVLQLLQ